MADRGKDLEVRGDNASEVLRAAVKLDGRPLRELASEVGCCKTTLTQDLRDPERMSFGRAQRLGDALGYDVAVQLTRRPNEDGPSE